MKKRWHIEKKIVNRVEVLTAIFDSLGQSSVCFVLTNFAYILTVSTKLRWISTFSSDKTLLDFALPNSTVFRQYQPKKCGRLSSNQVRYISTVSTKILLSMKMSYAILKVIFYA